MKDRLLNVIVRPEMDDETTEAEGMMDNAMLDDITLENTIIPIGLADHRW